MASYWKSMKIDAVQTADYCNADVCCLSPETEWNKQGRDSIRVTMTFTTISKEQLTLFDGTIIHVTNFCVQYPSNNLAYKSHK